VAILRLIRRRRTEAVSGQNSAVSFQLSAFSFQLSAFSLEMMSEDLWVKEI
jgi:hypothetical protein